VLQLRHLLYVFIMK